MIASYRFRMKVESNKDEARGTYISMCHFICRIQTFSQKLSSRKCASPFVSLVQTNTDHLVLLIAPKKAKKISLNEFLGDGTAIYIISLHSLTPLA